MLAHAMSSTSVTAAPSAISSGRASSRHLRLQADGLDAPLALERRIGRVQATLDGLQLGVELGHGRARRHPPEHHRPMAVLLAAIGRVEHRRHEELHLALDVDAVGHDADDRSRPLVQRDGRADDRRRRRRSAIARATRSAARRRCRHRPCRPPGRSRGRGPATAPKTRSSSCDTRAPASRSAAPRPRRRLAVTPPMSTALSRRVALAAPVDEGAGRDGVARAVVEQLDDLAPGGRAPHTAAAAAAPRRTR